MSSLCLSLGLCAAPSVALAQGGAPEPSPAFVHGELPPQPQTSVVRSPLWLAVDAVYRQREASAEPLRRLNEAQRQQLREQIRGASLRANPAPQPVLPPRPLAQSE